MADTVRVLDEPAALVRFVRANAIDRVVFYGLGRVLGAERSEARFAALVRDLRAAGVSTIGAPIAAASRVDAVVAYDRGHPEARIDLIVTELEYWHDCAGEGVRACFAPMDELLATMRITADREDLQVGAYLGYPTAAEARRIAARVDFVFLNYAVRAPGPWRRERLRDLAGVEIWPIFYARGEVDMYAWLAAHGLDAAEAAFLADAELPIGGFQYFSYEAMPARPVPAADRPRATP